MVRLGKFRRFTLVAFFALCAITVMGQELRNNKETTLRFEVLSVSVISSAEERLRKLRGSMPVDVSVRLRLTNKGRATAYFFTYRRDMIHPYGHIVKETEKGFLWFDGFNLFSERTLGIDKLTHKEGAWIRIEPEMALEWESFDSTSVAGERRAQTVFVKEGEKIWEIISDLYRLPEHK